MKKISLIILLLFIIQVHTKAQDGFVIKASGPHSFNVPEDMTITPTGNMLSLFSSIPLEGSQYVNEIRELNPEGEIVNTFIYTDSIFDYVEYTNCLIVEDSLFVFGTGYRFTAPSTYCPFLFMHKFDLQLNFISSHEFWLEELNPNMIHGRRIKYKYGYFYCIKYFNENGSIPFYVKISRQGELIDFHIEGEQGKTLVPYDFTIQANGEIQTYALSGSYISPYLLSGLICNYTKDFQLKEYFQLPYYFSSWFTHEAINDSIYYLSGHWLDLTSAPMLRAGVLKIKNDTTILSELLYSTYPDSAAAPAYHHSIEVLADGNLIFCFTGDISQQLYPQSQPAKINLMKLTPDLDIIWHRYIGEPDSKFDAYVMHTTETDEIVILGAYSLAPPAGPMDMQALFIKTNSEGIITSTNQDLSGAKSSEALLYPNPARGMVAIEFSMAYTCANLEILNISGQKVFTTQLTANRQRIDISGIASGTYVYRIFNKQGLDESGKLIVE